MWYSFKRIEYQSVRKVIVLFLDFQLVAKKREDQNPPVHSWIMFKDYNLTIFLVIK